MIRKLDRIQFGLDKQNPLFLFGCSVELNKEFSKEELPHFRFVFTVVSPWKSSPYRTMNLGVCNNQDRTLESVGSERNCGLAGAAWYESLNNKIVSWQSVRAEKLSHINIYYSLDFIVGRPISPTLADLDENIICFFANETVTKYIKTIRIFGNEYILWSANISQIVIDPPNVIPRSHGDFLMKS